MRRITIGVLTVVILTLAIAVVYRIAQAQPAAQPAGVGIYYKTYRGMDFQSLDTNDVVFWAPSTGGGVWVKSHTRSVTVAYLEARVDLPSGAQVTEVTFYVRACANPRPQLYFASYAPASSGYDNIIDEFQPPIGDCAQTQAVVQPVTPPVTIDNATQVYVIGYVPNAYYGTETYSADTVTSLLVGARVTYQMPGAFLPLTHR